MATLFKVFAFPFIFNIHSYKPILVNIRQITAITATNTPQYPNFRPVLINVTKKNTLLEKSPLTTSPSVLETFYIMCCFCSHFFPTIFRKLYSMFFIIAGSMGYTLKALMLNSKSSSGLIMVGVLSLRFVILYLRFNPTQRPSHHMCGIVPA